MRSILFLALANQLQKQASPRETDQMPNESLTYSMFWADTVLLFAGLLVIALALLLAQRLGNRPVQFGFSKLGLDLKADRLTFVLVVGLILIGVGIFFRYQNYEALLKTLQVQVETSKAAQAKHDESLTELRNKFMVYDLGLNIVFPNVPGDDVETSFEIEVHTRRDVAETFQLSNYKPVTTYGKTSVYLNNLNRGAQVRIHAKDKRDNTKWTSVYDIMIPETEIQMRKGDP